MAQTVSGIAELAKTKLAESFEADSKADKVEMVKNILTELSPSDPSQVMQMVSLNPELLDEELMNLVIKKVQESIKVGLEEQVTILEAEMISKQEEIDQKQAEIDAEKTNIQDLSSVIEGIGQ